jgi:peptidoglycan/xylan/chitin deacetylase (PgdA/CDA1 family)
MKNTPFNSLAVYFLLVIALFSCSWEGEERTDQTYIVITFDDQHHTIYDVALPLMEKFGFQATNVINTGRIGSGDRLTWQQVEDLEFHYGWETAGHTLHHPNLPFLNDEEALYQIEQDWINLKERGLSHETFALPRGHATERDYEIIRRFYKNIRNSRDKRMYKPIDRLNIGYFAYLSSYSAEEAIMRITEGILEKETLIVIGFHRFNDPNHTHSCTEAEFYRILKFIASLELEVVTLKRGIEITK